MGAAAAIRLQVESSLARRVPAALTLKIKQAPEVFSTGMASTARDAQAIADAVRHALKTHVPSFGEGLVVTRPV